MTDVATSTPEEGAPTASARESVLLRGVSRRYETAAGVVTAATGFGCAGRVVGVAGVDCLGLADAGAGCCGRAVWA